MKKRILSIMLAFGMLAAFMPCIAGAKMETYEGFKYDVNYYKDSVTISQYIGDESEVVIPAEINGMPVTKIGEGAFEDCTLITEITIPDGVTKIGDGAFEGCTSLKEITLPSCSMGIVPFLGCSSLTDVYFGGTLEQWEYNQGKYDAGLNVHCLKESTTSSADYLETLWRSEPGVPLNQGIVAELEHRGYTIE